MKITKNTRINAVMFAQKNKHIVLSSKDQNITLTEYLQKSMLPFAMSLGNMPNPSDILGMDFKVEDVFTNQTGHTFTTLVSKTDDYVCSVVKLDLATP
jgi:hypothetical protein